MTQAKTTPATLSMTPFSPSETTAWWPKAHYWMYYRIFVTSHECHTRWKHNKCHSRRALFKGCFFAGRSSAKWLALGSHGPMGPTWVLGPM